MRQTRALPIRLPAKTLKSQPLAISYQLLLLPVVNHCSSKKQADS
jgi:hypothetical protein